MEGAPGGKSDLSLWGRCKGPALERLIGGRKGDTSGGPANDCRAVGAAASLGFADGGRSIGAGAASWCVCVCPSLIAQAW